MCVQGSVAALMAHTAKFEWPVSRETARSSHRDHRMTKFVFMLDRCVEPSVRVPIEIKASHACTNRSPSTLSVRQAQAICNEDDRRNVEEKPS
jgi:hypothetical protein